MQIIDENRGGERVRSILAGVPTKKLMAQFQANRDALDKRIEAGITTSSKLEEHRGINWTDPCPCQSGQKFQECCGLRMVKNDPRIQS